MVRSGFVTSVTLVTMASLLGAPPAQADGQQEPSSTGTPPLVRLAPEADSVVRSATVPVEASATTEVVADGFSMLALTWRGGTAPDAEVRTRADGTWSAWAHLHPVTDGPSAGSGERAVVGGTELLWVDDATSVQVRADGAASDLELLLLDPGSLPGDRAAPAAGAAGGQAGAATLAAPAARTAAAKKATSAPPPRIRSRRAWGADNSLRNGRPTYTASLKQVHLHHTATGNDYTRADVPGIIRGMYRYHTRTLGWFDIGYNFLIDRFGRAWVGRSGGPTRMVQGAHTRGFNHRSVGIALIGNFEQAAPRPAAMRTLIRMAAWKLDSAQRRAKGTVLIASRGSDRYAAGTRVRLPVIDGHRDTGATACPGELLYDRIPALRNRTQKRLNRFG